MYNHGCYNSWDSNSVGEKTSLIVKIGEFFLHRASFTIVSSSNPHSSYQIPCLKLISIRIIHPMSGTRFKIQYCTKIPIQGQDEVHFVPGQFVTWYSSGSAVLETHKE